MADHGVQSAPTRRQALKTIAYVTPAILTLPVIPSFASAGSASWDDNRKDAKEKTGKKLKD